MKEETIWLEVESDLGAKILRCEELGIGKKSAWLIRLHDKTEYILKTNEVIDDQHVITRLKKNIISKYRNVVSRELQVYRQLSTIRFEHFKFPKLIKGKEHRYLLVEYVPSFNGWDKNEAARERVAKSLYEFNTSNLRFKQGVVEKILSDIKRKTSLKILVWSFVVIPKSNGIWDAMTCLWVLFKCTLQQRKFKHHYFLHRDLIGNNNVLTSAENGDIYFIDFESAVEERRWILNDIIDVSLSTDLEVDRDLLNEYMKLLSESDKKRLNMKAQVRIALIHRIVRRILSHNEYSKKNRHVWISFLKNILLKDHHFDDWYEKNVGI
jgi:hypothetical protein